MSNTKTFTIEKEVGARTVTAIASTGTLDRMNDRVLASGWVLDAFRKNPVILWGHDYNTPPIARADDIRISGDTLVVRTVFPPEGIYELADTVFGLIKAGTISTMSVGFRPIASRPNEDGGDDFTRQELLEISFVSVPANAEAVVTARSKGVNRAALDAFLKGARRRKKLAECSEYAEVCEGERDGDGEVSCTVTDCPVLQERGLVHVSPGDIKAALGDIVDDQIAHALRTAFSGDPIVLELAEGHDEIEVRGEDLLAAMRAVVDEAMARALSRAAGRID